MESDLYAHEIGQGFPILIIHGWVSSGKVEELDFEPIFGTTSGFRRIYVDLPGMGRTPANNVKDLDEMYHRLTQFVDARLGGSRFLIVGSSCGAYLARALAQKYAQQVDGLLLRVPLIETENGMRDTDAFQPLIADKQLVSDMPADDQKLLGNILIQTPAYLTTLKARFDSAITAAIREADSRILDPIRNDPQRYRLSFASDFESTKFHAPTLIVCGRQDEVVGYRDSLRLLELYPRSTFAVLDRGNHGLPVDETGVFEALVRDWLVRVDEWRGLATRSGLTSMT